jgi:hypothetical protein
VDRRQSELERWCWEVRGAPAGQQFVELLKVYLDNTRIKNDDAVGNDYFLNQGEIRAYKKLINLFSKAPPTERKV